VSRPVFRSKRRNRAKRCASPTASSGVGAITTFCAYAGTR
jgi:hypothetical protein